MDSRLSDEQSFLLYLAKYDRPVSGSEFVIHLFISQRTYPKLEDLLLNACQGREYREQLQ